MTIQDYAAMVKSGVSAEAVHNMHKELDPLIQCTLCQLERIEDNK